jgi:hypothetical protein
MSDHATLEIPRLVKAPREAFLRKNECQIRSQALPLKSDPEISLHLSAVEMAEDIFDIHEIAGGKMAAQGRTAWVKIHERHAAAALQFRLYHLDQLAHLVGV